VSIDRRSLVGWLDRPAMRRARAQTVEPLGKLSLPNRPESVRMARRFVESVAHAYGAAHISDTAALLVSELATNVTRHARDAALFHIAVSRMDDRIRVEVHDPSPRFAVIRHADVLAEDGRGLHIVRTLAHGNGAYSLLRGKSTWYELIAWRHDRAS
jgi:anti-sigma regulatory factor (Ser/Thr protein kinase)